ncbi:MAG: heat-inducible transcriptional repressor HrcA [Gammaproteobacteria bacterium]|nr:heat-inducible transcriptional repressor HrcA [Gammaproteobacteria bacterium]
MNADRQKTAPSERSRHILRVLVEQYIRDGLPVGSRTLAKASGLDLSSATIRNVMADLEGLGFVASPHTSAGRIPTARGYRFFVDTLLKLQPLAAKDVTRLQHQLTEEMKGSAKDVASTASSALSSLTSLAGIVTIPRQSHVQLRQVEFLPLSDKRVLAILVMNDAEVENRILNVDRDYSSDELRRSANYLNEHFAGRELDVVRGQIVSELANMRETMNQLMIDAVSIAQQAFNPEVDKAKYVMSGETQLMQFNELSNVQTLRQLFDAFNQQQEILHLLDRSIAAQGVQIFIGEESGYSILDECSVVAAPYRVDDDTVGVLGVIGPTRMAYERVIPIVDITAKLVGEALNSDH